MWKFLITLAFNYIACDTLVADTKQGTIKGLKGDDFSMFLGIPYAKVNEDKPFEAAQPYPKFDSIYEAYNNSPACPQMENDVAIGNLDCLRLNVFVPNNTCSSNKLPVIIWIHGGAFISGYTTPYHFGPQHLVKRGVIVVTFNYRLGPYGFMCLDTPEVSGNQGLKDQLLAMRWVNDNIAFFGGDVNKITLMGESAGSVATAAHLLSKQEKLFDRIILLSGAIFKADNIVDANATVPLAIAEELDFKTDNVSEAVLFLEKTDTNQVITATSKLSLKFCVCIEKEFEGVESILTDRPYNLAVPKVRGMAVLAGFNSREGLTMDAKNSPDYYKYPNYFNDTLQLIFEYDEDLQRMVDIVRHYYTGDAELNENVRNDIIDFESDFFYDFPIQWSLDVYLRNGAKVIYQYMFSYEGGLNYEKNKYNITLKGAAHGDELGYLFIMSDNKTAPSTEDQLLIDRIATLWTNFAKYGDPTPQETELLPVSWTPISKDTIPYMKLDSELSMGSRPFNERLAFWELFFIANQRKLKGYTSGISMP